MLDSESSCCEAAAAWRAANLAFLVARRTVLSHTGSPLPAFKSAATFLFLMPTLTRRLLALTSAVESFLGLPMGTFLDPFPAAAPCPLLFPSSLPWQALLSALILISACREEARSCIAVRPCCLFPRSLMRRSEKRVVKRRKDSTLVAARQERYLIDTMQQ